MLRLGWYLSKCQWSDIAITTTTGGHSVARCGFPKLGVLNRNLVRAVFGTDLCTNGRGSSFIMTVVIAEAH